MLDFVSGVKWWGIAIVVVAIREDRCFANA
jgi:hypothetical protein